MRRLRLLNEIVTPVMRFTVGQCILLLLFMQIAVADDLRAQEILSQRISITVNEMDIEKVLEKIEVQTKIRFVYSAEIIGAERKVSFEGENQRLDAVLES